MAKFRIRENAGFRYIKDGRVTTLTIADDSDKDFKGQAHKFHPDPVPEEVAANVEANAKNRDVNRKLSSIGTMKRDEMITLVKDLTGVTPPDDVTKGTLQTILVEIQAGADPKVIAAEAFKGTIPVVAGKK